MNKSIIAYILGWIILLEGLFMLLPILVAAIYHESCGWFFVLTAAIGIILGRLITRKKPENNAFSMREGCVVTGLSWIVMSLLGCLPFVLSREIPSFTDALFETISGFTTTGASILNDVEALSQCMLFWRSFTHWLGGMGVLVFLLAIIQMTGGSNMNLMRAESPGPSVGKLVPKVMETARILYVIYTGITVVMFLFLIAGKMPVFDALTTALGTAGTGGFGIKGDSMASYSPYIQWVVTIFMIAFGVNFNAYYLLLLKKWRDAVHMEEVWTYLAIVGSAVAVFAITTFHMFDTIGDTIRHTAFTVGALITTTGFATVDFNTWPEISRIVVILLMFCGACAGSTGGGIKVSRIIIAFKGCLRELHYYAHPKSIKKVKVDGRALEEDVVRSVNVYFLVYGLLFVISLVCLSAEKNDFITNFTAVAATINNIGPGLEKVGPTGNFAFFSNFNKYVLMFDMLAGRLELFPMLMLLYPASWAGLFKKRKK